MTITKLWKFCRITALAAVQRWIWRDNMDELLLYKLVITPDPEDLDLRYVSEMGWIDSESFCVWVDYMWLDDFINGLKSIFGCDIFAEGGFEAKMQSDGVCIDLCDALGGYIDFKDVFPKEQFKH
nr:MAG TPA: hypothetical protein [Caudoviricetes sp.]